jgi:hypothetical protein
MFEIKVGTKCKKFTARCSSNLESKKTDFNINTIFYSSNIDLFAW